MSLHFEFYMSLDLHENVPDIVVQTLAYMVDGSMPEPIPPEHVFFEGDSWKTLLRPEPDASHFPGHEFSDFRKVHRFTQGGVDHYRHTLSFRITLLDDSFYEDWWALATWLAPHSATQDFVGFYREEFESKPTLLHFREGELVVEELPESLPEGA